MSSPADGHPAPALRRYEQQYEELKTQLQGLGYILQGSITERWIQCGKPGCRCQDDPEARHGPYYQWSWKTRGTTKSTYLDADQARQCKQWIKNHRALERILKRMRILSLRVARLQKIDEK